MREQGILFSGPMVRAILDGRKTQTRRLTGTFAPGMRLWVRETHAIACLVHWPDLPHRVHSPGEVAFYREGFDRSNSGLRWRPSIHMPRWASRITLLVTAVRQERLGAITDEDVVREGVELLEAGGGTWQFAELWDSIHGPGSWRDCEEDLVTVVSFTREAP